ncbi:MAG: NUDIX domain-containing protein [Patescibacteria group bacterium]|jgi:8-oxo-dGTP diphosphatase
MTHLKTITDSDLFPNAKDIKRNNYTFQESSRAVIFDIQNNVALMKTGVYQIHKLPGGTIEPGETSEQACLRECLEEVGYDVKITSELGYIDEYKDKRKEHRRSYCYIVKTVGEQKQLKLSKWEKDGKFEVVWTPLPQAIKLLQNDKPIDYDGNFILARDLEFLLQANKLLNI